MEGIDQGYNWLSFLVLALLSLFEWARGRFRQGRKTAEDWKMMAISSAGVFAIERPLQIFCVYLAMKTLLPGHEGHYGWLEAQYLLVTVIVFILVDEWLHGWAHSFTHKPRPANRFLAKVQAFYRGAHRAHHMNGGSDGKGELSASQVVVAGWGWVFMLPNYWFGLVCLYLGLVETWAIGTMIKSLWGIHVHTNWRYDLHLLNHPNRWVRRGMYALCHVFTFPNQHHQHHSRTGNSARNMNNFLALYDWLCWGTLVIEKQRPATYGWRQSPREAKDVWYRYLQRSF